MLPWPPLTWLNHISSARRDAYREICSLNSLCWQHHAVRFRGQWGQMPWSTMEVSCYGQWKIGRVSLYVHPLSIIRLIDCRLQPSGYTYILVYAASDSCCFQSYRQFINAHPRSYCWWLHWQCRRGLNGVWVLAVHRWVTYLLTRQPLGLIWIRPHLAEVVVYPWFAGVE